MSERHVTWDDIEQQRPLTMETGAEHKLILPERYRLQIRFDVDPDEPSSWDDRFTLFMTWRGKKYQSVKTVRDDRNPGDDYVDIVYDWCRPDAEYSVQHDPGKEGDPYFVFEDVPFAELFNE